MDAAFWHDLIEASKALLTPTIAVAAAYYARRQAVTARNKLRLDLFDRRYVIYRAVVDTIAAINLQGCLKYEQHQAFLATIRGARWVFDEEVGRFIEHELSEKIGKLMFEYADRQENSYDDYEPPAPEYERLRAWFELQTRAIDLKFAPHMALKE